MTMLLSIDSHAAYAYTGGKPLNPALPGVVCVHGALNDHSVWSLHSRWLAHHGRAVLAVDLPGHGRSGGAALGVREAARWLVRLIDAAGLGRTALVGHSMGSLIALEAAALLGERASALVMVATAYPMQVSTKLLELCRTDVSAAIDWVNALSHSTHAAKPSYPGPGFSIHGGGRALMQRLQAGYRAGHLFDSDFTACNAYTGLDAAAPLVRCPVTLVVGAHDQMTPPKAAAPLVQACKPAVVTLPAGHDLMAEDPEGLLNALRTALQL
jgi:pimeloyl-ACP methyl ester carboxylesterase